ncbi:glutathione S-transferase family protein [Hyphomicrobium sp.]|uniref:glutathione S-transferase family protein n=1 Tax=Hyphomicrobium sp. TaxID=82 RepID=UPI002E321532|nr:glutathione S-transferase family protein [Hyphomicrobium sp.]HEX2841922.1 glutathione S-transferase family protein [Hyphomicrobium sp.]
MATEGYRLVIGNKNTSSWSLRPWLALKQAGIDFTEIRINLRAPDKKEQIRAHSPAGRVPVLWADDLMVWDSLAILEYLADRHPDKALWPSDVRARAIARSAAAEMHSGFQALREHCPMNFLARDPKADHIDPVQVNIRRIVELWKDCRQRFGADGPFLFSGFSIADAMYAPVASRFRTYIENLGAFGDDGTCAAYIETLFALPAMKEWADGARQETASG